MDKSTRILFLCMFILISLHLSSQAGNNVMDKYKWLPSESAHRQYPMEIIKGDLILGDGSSIYIPDRKIFNKGWGELGSIHIVGEEMKPLPVTLKISWFSYTENKFYAGTFNLPFEKIHSLFEHGFESPNTGKKTTYNGIRVGLAPEGEIVVWIAGEGVVLEIASFQAKEANIDWKELLDNPRVTRDNYVKRTLAVRLKPEQLAALDKHGVPPGISKIYQKRHLWTPEILGTKTLCMWMSTCNGEWEFFNLEKGGNSRTDRGIPKVIDVDWKGTGNTHTAHITFDEDETFRAFKKISSDQSDHKMNLRIEISGNNIITVSLKDSQFIYFFKKAAAKVYVRD